MYATRVCVCVYIYTYYTYTHTHTDTHTDTHMPFTCVCVCVCVCVTHLFHNVQAQLAVLRCANCTCLPHVQPSYVCHDSFIHICAMTYSSRWAP